MSNNEEVIMIVKLWGVDQLHLHFFFFFNVFFQLFAPNVVYFLFFIYETYPHSSVLKTRIKCLQADTLIFLLMFCMFRYSYNKYIQINT